jgi:hypothetical protein
VVREIGSARTQAYILRNLGRAHLDVGQDTDGAVLLEQALVIHQAEGDTTGQAQDLQLLGVARSRTGHAEAARAAWHHAVSLFEGLGDGKQAARTLSWLAEPASLDADPGS